MIETLWTEEREKLHGVRIEQPKAAAKPFNSNKLGTQLNAIDAFLQSARKRLQKDPTIASNLLQETKVINSIYYNSNFFTF